MKQFLLKLLLLASFSFIVIICHAQPGTLDSSFGVNGRGKIPINIRPDLYKTPSVTAIQADGKIVIAGNFGYAYSGYILGRLSQDGSPDSTFATNGFDFFYDSTQTIYIDAVILQSDGKIVLGGVISNANYYYDFLLIRYNINGKIDSTFGTNGKAITNAGFSDQVLSLALQKDGKIIAAGERNPLGCMVRYNTNGKIDSSFGSNGIVFSGSFTTTSVQIQSDGRIISCGYGGDPDSFNVKPYSYFVIKRVLSNGATDSSFGKYGNAYVDFTGYPYSTPFAITILKNDDFVVVGTASNPDLGGRTGALAKLKSNGKIDSSYGTFGQVFTSFNGFKTSVNTAIAQNDGKIIISTFYGSSMALSRLMPNGSLDLSFGNNGFVTLNLSVNFWFYGFFPSNGYVALQSDGKIIAVGSSGTDNFSAQRLKGDEPITVNLQRNISVTEGNSGTTQAQFKVVLNRPSAYDVRVNYTTLNGNATSGSDYVAASGKAVIKAGKTSKTIAVNIIGDNVKEKNEKFALVIANPVNAQLGANDTATCTIKNDDPGFAASAAGAVNADIKTAGIKLYPNPAKDLLRIEGLEASGKTNISITDMNGNVVLKRSLTGSNTSLNIQQLAAGLYELRIASGNKVQAIRFVKE